MCACLLKCPGFTVNMLCLISMVHYLTLLTFLALVGLDRSKEKYSTTPSRDIFFFFFIFILKLMDVGAAAERESE